MGRFLFTFRRHPLIEAVSRRLDRSPISGIVLRYVVTLGTLAAVTQLLERSPLTNPLRGVFSVLAILICAWFGGFGPALLLAPLLLLIARLLKDEPERWAALTSRELFSIIVVTLISASIGLAGQYRRRLRTVTEQHAQKLRDQARALSQAPIVFREIHGRITQWNEGIERLFGWAESEAIGRLLHELLQTVFPSPLEEIQAELVRTGQWQGEVVHRHKDGIELHVATHWILYRDKSGNPIGVAEVHNDVTDLRRAEAAVREADRRKDEFLAVLAHELRNPLAPIRTGLELLKLAKDKPQVIEETRCVMERQMRQLVTLVDDLLDVSRISRGKLELRKCQVALSEVVRSAVEAAKPTIDAAGHNLTVTLPEAPAYLHADPHRLAQVLCNLLDNAAKYTPDGGRIWLTAERQGSDIVISIKDNGMGVPAEMLETVFEMFTRSENIKITHAGLGIGLALVKSIIELHGGHVEARSEGSGRGAEFSAKLPLMLEVTATIQQPVRSRRAAHSCKRRVLVVDDNEAAGSLLSVLVEMMGNEVQIAHDGVEAIEVAFDFQPDVVLMDLGMPRLDGYGAASHIRQQPWGQDMLLVALTGWGQDGHKQRAKEVGFDNYLVKPVDPIEIERLLADATKRAGDNGSTVPVVD